MCEYIITEDFLMDKYIYDESNGLWYELQGDYYIPCITLPTEKEHKFIGLWGQRYKRYLQEHKRAVYTTLLTSGKDRKSTRLNSSHRCTSRMPSSA